MAAIALALSGCATTASSQEVSQAVMSRLTPGLANVPWISGSTSTNDERIPDVVSNGLDACGRGFEHSRLWNQWPPCPKPTPPIAGRDLLPTSTSQQSEELVRPWEESTVFAWPCTPMSEQPGPGEATGTVVICR
jgi:hypothetical protein